MIRITLAGLATAALALTLAASAFSGGTGAVKLVGTVGPGFKITLTKAGHKVKTLKVGTYTFVVHDKAAIHSFGLDGPHGFAKDMTSVKFVGTKTFTLKLKAGKYKYYCTPHEATMFGFFMVK
jgi:plastocyanin